ncbi:MAG: MGMT family protein [bacterium]|nr:MGMT family protein [bacterium]
MNIVPIPEKMQKFYGTGTMLHPDKEMVAELVQEIPFGKVATIETICTKMAKQQNTDVACPMRTGNFVKAFTEMYSDNETLVPYWRVIRNNHLLINSNYTERCADMLKQEDFELRQNSKGEYMVVSIENRLFDFS